MNTENVTITFGKHKGELWTRIPISYLRWISNELSGDNREMAVSELKRRGVGEMKEINVSVHAIDRASLRFIHDWKLTRKEGEGLATWLYRLASNGLEKGIRTNGDNEGNYVVQYNGFRLVFIDGNDYPTLKTIMKKDV